MSEFLRSYRPMLLILGLPLRSERPVGLSRNEPLWKAGKSRFCRNSKQGRLSIWRLGGKLALHT